MDIIPLAPLRRVAAEVIKAGERLNLGNCHQSDWCYYSFNTLQRLQVWLFKFEHLSGDLLSFADYEREIFPAAFQQRFIQLMKYAKITECLLTRGEKGLLRGVRTSLMKRRSAPHTAH